MAANDFVKVILNGTTLMDVTDKTVTSNVMLNNYTAVDNSGTSITGNIATMTAGNLTASGSTVTAAAGYYASNTSKSVSAGTAGTPTATKGTVSNYAISITPSVTNTTGYITGGTKTGTAVSVSASELVSGTFQITSSGAKDVTNYATVLIAGGTATTPTKTITANPTLSLNSSTGVVTANVTGSSSVTPTVSAGYVSSGTGGTISVSGSSTYQLTTQAAQTITPGTQNITVASGRWLTGAQTVSGDANLVAANIANGVTIFGVQGTHAGGTDTSDATATSADLLSGKTAYAKGVKLTGTIPTKTSTDLSATWSNVTIPSGYYASAITKAVTAGTAGTPTASKGTVSNNQISVTPSVTNTSGYIAGGTKTGTAVTVSASELVGGTYIITGTGNSQNVVNYAYVNVPSGSAYTQSTLFGITPTISVSSSGQISVSGSSSVSVTPTVSAGWVSVGSAGDVVASVSGTSQLTTASATTITPGTQAITAVASQRYTTGTVTVAGDTDLVASNIKKDVNIFGVTGTYEGGSSSIVAPVGSVICMSSNTNPSTDLGGTWELIDKEFASYHGTNTTVDGSSSSDIFVPYASANFVLEESTYTTTTTPNYGCVMTRSGHTIQVTLRAKSSTTVLSDDGAYLGTFNLTPLGLSSIVDKLYLTGWSESGNGILMLQVYHSGQGTTSHRLLESDVVTKTTDGTIAANSELLVTITFNVNKDAMLDSACDKFYFKKTSNSDYTVTAGPKTITAGGTYNPASDSLDYYSQVTVSTLADPGILNPSAELVATYSYNKLIVTDESVTIPAYTTTATTLKAAESAYGTYTTDTANYDYFVVQEGLVTPVYNASGATIGAGRYVGFIASYVYDYLNMRSGLITKDGLTSLAYAAYNSASTYRTLYNSSSTTSSISIGVSLYGCYMSFTAPSFGSTISITRPALMIRGSTTYLNSTYWGYLTDIRYQWKAKIYRIPKNANPPGGMLVSDFTHLAEIFNNGGTL